MGYMYILIFKAIGCIFSEMMDLKILFEGKAEGD